MLRPLSPAVVKSMLTDGDELALIDVREELIYSRKHLLWARSVPLSRIELRFARLVPRKSTRIVLVDDGDGLVERAAAILMNAEYVDVAYLEGGVGGWEAAGLVTFSGMHVPSKAFGEFVEHDSGTPSVSAQELDAMMRSGTKMRVLDSRPFDEFTRVSIPTGVDVPGAELVLRVRDMVPSPDTTIVVNCAGRTRSIIGAQSLIDAGVPNRVVALRNGTMGWHLAGLKTASGETQRFPDVTGKGLAWARNAAEAVAKRFCVQRIDRAALARLQADTARTTYVFDVRDPDEYRRGHFSGAVSAPGGQLVQATDTYAGTLGARIVLCDDKEARALMTGAWLRRMGWQEVFVLAESGDETGDLAPAMLGTPAMDAAIDVAAMPADATVIDLARSPDYRRGHIPEAWFAIRGRLDKALPKIAAKNMLVLTSEDGWLAGLAVAEARRLTRAPVKWLKGGTAAWTAAGKPLSQEPQMADEALDIWLKPYERAGDPKVGMQEYLTWEVDLIDRIKQDGTTNFLTGR
ncbi:MAG TPA: rhodanese-like domain-containing protein [Pseudolabrys sp.]|nr:rhodanese-like domain-containing protein [Pseudolabrys sp.]